MAISLSVITTGLVAYLVGEAWGQSCSRYGGGSCCEDLQPVTREYREDAYPNQPFYFKFAPDSDAIRDVDNVCVTIFPLPDDPETFLAYYSYVHYGGYNEILSFIVNQPETGIRRLGRALCSISTTIFAQVDHSNVDPACTDLFLVYRCVLRGECSEDMVSASGIPVYGFSNIRRPISRSCMNSIESTIRNNGLQDQDYYIFPNRLPSRCVFNQVCTVLPVLQQFRQSVGLAFPALRSF